MTNQLNERLTKTNVRIDEFKNELKNKKTKKVTLMKTYKILKIKNEKLVILLLKKSAQLTINKRNILFFFLISCKIFIQKMMISKIVIFVSMISINDVMNFDDD